MEQAERARGVATQCEIGAILCPVGEDIEPVQPIGPVVRPVCPCLQKQPRCGGVFGQVELPQQFFAVVKGAVEGQATAVLALRRRFPWRVRPDPKPASR